MKLSLCSILALAAPSALAFAPSAFTSSTSTTSLHLFGGGGKKEEGGGGGPAGGMMNQLAMFKKAQEVAQKKKKIDDELQAMDFVAEAADGKVKGTFKFVPVANPMDPNPDYDAIKFEFDDAFYESATPEELGKAVEETILTAITDIDKAAAEKYMELQVALAEAMGQALPQQE